MQYCVGHKEPLFSPKTSYTHVSPFAFPDIDQLIIPDDSMGEKFHGNYISEYIQLFGLAEFLKDLSGSEKLHIFQYRKFISFKRSSQKSTNQPYSYISTPEDAIHLFPSQDELLGLEDRLLVGPAIKLRSMAHNYAQIHLAEDFSKFILSLSTLRGFNAKRCEDFIDCMLLIPAPSLGVTRIDIFLKQMEILKSVWDHFSSNFLKNRNGYQRRVGGFLLERLHSFLLIEEINISRTFKVTQGNQIVISNTPIISHTI